MDRGVSYSKDLDKEAELIVDSDESDRFPSLYTRLLYPRSPPPWGTGHKNIVLYKLWLTVMYELI